jgi:hypothetical protein
MDFNIALPMTDCQDLKVFHQTFGGSVTKELTAQ